MPQTLPGTNITPSPGFELEASFTHGNSLYHLLTNPNGLSYFEARAEAARLGGALASIESAEENTAIFDVINFFDDAWVTASGTRELGPWIGGMRDITGGFSWETGAGFQYTNWASGEPNNYSGDENHVHFLSKSLFGRADTWNDIPQDGGWPVFFSSASINSMVVETRFAPSQTPLKDTDKIFKEQGKLGFLAQLAEAAYHLEPGEEKTPEKDAVNDVKANSSKAYQDIAKEIQLLSFRDFDSDTFFRMNPDATLDFPRLGLDNGIYTYLNAAALVGRSDDALFLSFRGTNDNDHIDVNLFNATVTRPTPDMDHWIGKGDHFNLFTPLIDTIRSYVADPANGIADIFVTGHSLGAAMVEALTSEWNAANLTAVAFANPGYGFDIPGEPRQTSFLINKDIIFWPSLLVDNDGDANTIYHNLLKDNIFPSSAELHSMELYSDFARFFAGEGMETEDFQNLRNIDYDRVSVHAERDPNTDEVKIGTGNDTISGTVLKGRVGPVRDNVNDLILGGAGDDTIDGRDGHDYIMGGAGNDIIDGGGGRDHVLGGAGSDGIDGGGGRDRILGGDGTDVIKGGGGRDIIIGGRGFDTMTGNGGSDRFVFETIADTNPGRVAKTDLIRKFDNKLLGRDKIDLGKIDADKTQPGNQDFDFIASQRFSGTTGELRFEKKGGTTQIRGDVDGDGAGDFLIRLAGKYTLDADDFIL